MNTTLLILTVVGVWIGFDLLWLAGMVARQRWVRPWLNTRHERICGELNQRWQWRVVREPATGRVGLCVKVCTARQGIRDLLWPRWTAAVVPCPRLAGRMMRPPENFMDAFLRISEVSAGLAGEGAMLALPVRAIAPAPATESAAFRAEMEGQRS